MPHQMEPITGSKTLIASSYDKDTQTMRVQFNNGAIAEYDNVTPEINQAFWAAPSQGSYFHTIIKPNRGWRYVDR